MLHRFNVTHNYDGALLFPCGFMVRVEIFQAGTFREHLSCGMCHKVVYLVDWQSIPDDIKKYQPKEAHGCLVLCDCFGKLLPA